MRQMGVCVPRGGYPAYASSILSRPHSTLLSEDKIAVQSSSRLFERLSASHAKARLAPICRAFFLSPLACP